MRKPQTVKVIEYMDKYGSITPLDAFKDLGIMRLAAVIFILKDRGYAIKSVREYGKNRDGDTVHYSRYSYAEK